MDKLCTITSFGAKLGDLKMDMLNEKELSIVKRLFLVNASNYFKDIETLKTLSEAYKKITGNDLKADWNEWNNFNLNLLGIKS